MGVDHGRGYVAVPQELLYGADVVAGFEEVGRKAMTEAVARRAFGEVGVEARCPERFLDYGFVEVVAAQLPGFCVAVLARRWE